VPEVRVANFSMHIITEFSRKKSQTAHRNINIHPMRSWPYLFLVIVVTGCTTSRHHLSGRAEAQIKAEDYILHLKPEPTAAEKEDILQDFTTQFFQGFTDPDASILGRPAVERGFKEGQKFRRHCSELEVRHFMEDYGYTYVEETGTWTVRFEVSSFSPRSNPDGGWWLSYFGNTKADFPKDLNKLKNPIYYRVTGFLSPKGEYGHMGGSSHEFFATKIEYIKDGEQ
jgi:hypothetical protein